MSHNPMKALITIVDRSDGIALSKLYEQNDVKLHLQIAADGTASSELLNTLGLTHREKALLISLAPGGAIDALMNRLYDDYRGILRVRGLAFSVGLTALSGAVDAALNAAPHPEGGSNMISDKEYSLILVAVNHGYTDLVMQTACKAGATGGTVIRGRWVGANHLEQFHGITLQDEKEVLAIACGREKRNAIMDAINQSHGLKSKHQAVVCSVPIDRMLRLG